MKKTLSLMLAGAMLMSAPAIAQTDRDYNSEEKRMAKVEKKFDKIDANNDDRITLEEWTNHHNEKFREMDSNNDGVITLEEARDHERTLWERMKKEGREIRDRVQDMVD